LEANAVDRTFSGPEDIAEKGGVASGQTLNPIKATVFLL